MEKQKPFLRTVAEVLFGIYGHDPRKACVVLPNRRAGLFLKKHLAQVAGKTIWSPEALSIEDFVMKHSGLRLADPVTQMLELYAVHAAIKPGDQQDFEEFAGWGQVVIKDFNELDLYMADPAYLFSYLTEAKAMALWSPDGQPMTEFQLRYLRFYQSLHEYYQGLRNRLLSAGLAYQGMAYRYFAEHIETIASSLPYDQVYFTGLNALTTAEEKIVDHLLIKDKARIFWDADKYYLGKNLKEAGRFIDAYLERWPSTRQNWVGDNFSAGDKKIIITGVPGMTGQAKLAGQILADSLPSAGEHEKVAIVLADERLLLPVLHSLPEAAQDVNITMGYPLRATSLYQFFRTWYQMHMNARKYQEARNEAPGSYFTRDVLKLLLHHLISIWNEESNGMSSTEPVLKMLKSHNHVFIHHQTLKKYFQEHHPKGMSMADILFTPWADSAEAIKSSTGFIIQLRDQLTIKNKEPALSQELILEYAYHFFRIFNLLAGQIKENQALQSLQALQKILFQVLDMTRIPFYGEPLKGVQVMGLLETRALDFDHVILLAANEGVLPAGRSLQSFIPFDIRRETGLPTHHEKDAVFAYHFYRLLQRASKVNLVYDTEPNELGGGEQSRFITQVLYELPRYNPDIKPRKQLLSIPPLLENLSRPIVVEKNPAVMERLKEKGRSGLSPTSLNLYISCPLKFYFQVVAGLEEEEDLEENIEARTLGSVIHEAMRQVYEPFTGNEIRPEMLTERKKELESILRDAFRKEYPNGDIEYGRNHLVFKAALHLAQRFLTLEAGDMARARMPGFRMLSQEKALSAPLMELPGSQGEMIRIKGTPDRIDRWDGKLRIIDYKTGLVREDELKVKEWEALFSLPKHAKGLQLLIYAWLFRKNNPDLAEPVSGGIISFRSLGKRFMEVTLPDDQEEGKTLDHAFEEGLTGLVESIFDPGRPFDQTMEEKNCEYCPYLSICNRL